MRKGAIPVTISLHLLALIMLTLSSCGDGGSETNIQPIVGSGTATLSWDAPTTNADGTALNGLAGYKIHYGTSSGNYTVTIDISDPNTNDRAIDNLAPGTYYFVVTAYNSLGFESGYSNEESKTIQ